MHAHRQGAWPYFVPPARSPTFYVVVRRDSEGIVLRSLAKRPGQRTCDEVEDTLQHVPRGPTAVVGSAN